MARTSKQLLESKRGIEAAIRILQSELRQIEIEQTELGKDVRLDDDFLSEIIVPLLATKPKGMTASEIKRALKVFGHTVNPNSFRTFLTRNKDRGRLELNSNTSPGRWILRIHQSDD